MPLAPLAFNGVQIPQPYVAGPAHIFVAHAELQQSAASQPYYLGTAESKPRIQIRPAWSSVYRTASGREIPTDRMYEGQEAFIIADLNRWDERVFKALQQRVCSQTINQGKARGTDSADAIGSMMIAEGLTQPLWIQFPHSQFGTINPNLPAGYRFRATYLLGPDDLELSARPGKIRCIWHALRPYTISPGSDEVTDEDQVLYDHDMTGLPTLTGNVLPEPVFSA